MKEDRTTDRVLSLAGEWSCRLDPNLLGELRVVPAMDRHPGCLERSADRVYSRAMQPGFAGVGRRCSGRKMR